MRHARGAEQQVVAWLDETGDLLAPILEMVSGMGEVSAASGRVVTFEVPS